MSLDTLQFRNTYSEKLDTTKVQLDTAVVQQTNKPKVSHHKGAVRHDTMRRATNKTTVRHLLKVQLVTQSVQESQMLPDKRVPQGEAVSLAVTCAS